MELKPMTLTKKPTKKLHSFTLDENLVIQAKHLAKLHNRSLSNVVELALKNVIESTTNANYT